MSGVNKGSVVVFLVWILLDKGILIIVCSMVGLLPSVCVHELQRFNHEPFVGVDEHQWVQGRNVVTHEHINEENSPTMLHTVADSFANMFCKSGSALSGSIYFFLNVGFLFTDRILLMETITSTFISSGRYGR